MWVQGYYFICWTKMVRLALERMTLLSQKLGSKAEMVEIYDQSWAKNLTYHYTCFKNLFLVLIVLILLNKIYNSPNHQLFIIMHLQALASFFPTDHASTPILRSFSWKWWFLSNCFCRLLCVFLLLSLIFIAFLVFFDFSLFSFTTKFISTG